MDKHQKLLLRRIKQSGLTDRRFAEEVCCVHRRTLRRWKNGDTPIPVLRIRWLEKPTPLPLTHDFYNGDVIASMGRHDHQTALSEGQDLKGDESFPTWRVL